MVGRAREALQSYQMRVRFSTAVGMPVVDEEMTEQYGALSNILIHPDTGKVAGFFVRMPGSFRSHELFLASEDILRWGLRVVVRDGEVFSPIEDRIRLRSLLEERRYFLSQRIVTDTGRSLGRCMDVQFDTMHFMVDWFWPKRWWKWRDPLPLSQIIEVRADAIVVRDPSLPASEKAQPESATLLNQLPEAA
jgi:uncharacterized protein YrrD